MIDTETTDTVMTNTESKQRLTGITDGMGRVLIKGSGDLASGIALRLHRAGFRILMTDIAVPTTVRRTVAFSPAVYQGRMQVEDVTGVLCDSVKVAEQEIQNGNIAVMVDETARCIHEFHPDVVVDAILAKRNLGTKITDAPFVVGVGPGFTAGEDCHCVVETKRGHYLGRCIWKGSAIPNTGIPGLIGGYGLERLIKAPAAGIFKGTVEIGAVVKKNDVVGYVDQTPVLAQIDGVVRGLLQDGVEVTTGMKSGDVDPRCDVAHCFTVSDKASSIGGGVLEAVLNYRFRPHDHMPVAMVLLAAGDSRRAKRETPRKIPHSSVPRGQSKTEASAETPASPHRETPGKTPPVPAGTAPAPRQPPGPAGVPPFAGPAPPPSASPPGNADRRASPRKRPAPPGRLLAARPPAAAARPERGCASASVGRPPAGRCPAGPGLPSRRGNLYRAPFRPRAALPRTAPGRRSPRRSASPVRRPVKTAPHKRPPFSALSFYSMRSRG